MNEYEIFLNRYFPQINNNPLFNDVYKLVCKNNILTDIYLKYSKIDAERNILFLNRYKWGLNKILLYLPLNDGIGINASIRYSIEQLLKFLYSICFDFSIEKINQTSYRHIKDDLKNRDLTIKLDQKDLAVLYTFYAKYSNDVHDKNTSRQEIGFLEEILKGDNNFIIQVYNDLLKLTKQYDKMMVTLFNITINDLSLAESKRIQRHMNSKQYIKLFSLTNGKSEIDK